MAGVAKLPNLASDHRFDQELPREDAQVVAVDLADGPIGYQADRNGPWCLGAFRL